MSYKKRAKGHWNAGKDYKGNRKAKEREYAKKDIKQQLDEQDPDFRYKKYTHTKNEKMSLEHKIDFYSRLINTSWLGDIKHRIRNSLRKLKKKWKALYGK